MSVVAATVVLTGCGAWSLLTDDEPSIVVAGDSISVGLGVALRESVADGSEVEVIGVGGTGLARPDGFDWPARLEELAAGSPPPTLVFSVGSNDAQDLTDASGNVVATFADTAAWDDEYRARLARTFDALAGTGTTVVWVGHLRVEDGLVGDTNRRVHDLATEVAASRDWVDVEDLRELTAPGDGAVAADHTGSDCLIADGLHLSGGCYMIAADRLLDRPGMG